jgi:hypothetical protein
VGAEAIKRHSYEVGCQAVLERLGSQVYRIWSTDWFENAVAESKMLIAHLKSIEAV